MDSTVANIVPALELRRLLFELRDFRPDIGIRFRVMGEMWHTNHHKILKITEKGVVLNDERNNKLVFIQDLNNVMQFEIDNPYQIYQPHFHYTVDPTLMPLK
jgi:hypothetical protein